MEARIEKAAAAMWQNAAKRGRERGDKVVDWPAVEDGNRAWYLEQARVALNAAGIPA